MLYDPFDVGRADVTLYDWLQLRSSHALLDRPQNVVQLEASETVKFVGWPNPVPFTVRADWPAAKNGPELLTQLSSVGRFPAEKLRLFCQSSASCAQSCPIEAFARSGNTESFWRVALVLIWTFPKPGENERVVL